MTRYDTRFDIRDTSTPIGQAFRILHMGFIVAPIIAGLDKFFDLLTNWDKYLSPFIANMVPAHAFMMFVGVVEIAAGLLVAFIPRYGAYVVAAWLAGIVLNLLTTGTYFDVALRDFGLMLGALSLGRLAQAHWAATHMVEEPIATTTYTAPTATTTATTTTTTEERRAA